MQVRNIKKVLPYFYNYLKALNVIQFGPNYYATGILLCSLILNFSSIAQDKGMGELTISIKADETTEHRLALVIGNKDYNNTEASLKNPINDANNMSKMLSKLGFTVILKTNLNRIDFEKAIDKFGEQLQGYQVGLFYYSGNGIQAQGENYLVPIDASSIGSEPIIKYKT